MGISGEAYRPFKRLNQRVIRKALDEVNRKSDVQASVEFLTQRRHVMVL